MIVLCSRLRKSNIRTLPSAPQLTNTSTLFAQKRTSKTSLSWAINCVFAVRVGISQIVHVVSILLVIIKLGDTVFQSRDVKGAVCSGVLEFDKRAKGLSFMDCWTVEFADWPRWIDEDGVAGPDSSAGRDQRRRWSPLVARRSVDCFCEDGGSHSRRVTGYEWVASAILTNSRPYFGPPAVYGSWGVIFVSRIWI